MDRNQKSRPEGLKPGFEGFETSLARPWSPGLGPEQGRAGFGLSGLLGPARPLLGHRANFGAAALWRQA